MSPTRLRRTAQAIRSRRGPDALVSVLGGAGLLPQRARSEPQAVHDRHPAAERDRRAAPGPRAEQHAARHPHPQEADAGLRDALDAGHRSRRHRHAGGGRAAAAARKRRSRGTTWAARGWSSGSGSGRTSTRARILGQLKQMGCSCDWQRTRFTLDDVCARAVRAHVLRPVQGRPDLPRQAAGQLGHVPADGRQRRRGVPRDGARATSGTSSIR